MIGWVAALFGASALAYLALRSEDRAPCAAEAVRPMPPLRQPVSPRAAADQAPFSPPQPVASTPSPAPPSSTRTSLTSNYQINLASPQIAQWLPHLKAAAVIFGPAMHADIDQLVSFGLAWMGIESGGNPCAVGNRKLTVPPGGAPQEIGLFQIYNPDDFKELGVDPLELVAYCVRPVPGLNNPQKLAQPMTPEQIGKHIVTGMQMIGKKHAYAGRYLAAAGAQWPTHSQDYWRMVKAVHALPVLVNTGLGQVAKKLGRAPLSWAEYRAVYETINPRAKFDPAKAQRGEDQDGYYRALENAEWTGGQVVGLSNV